MFTLTTALITFWYSLYTQKYQSLFVTSALNLICYVIITAIAYFWEGSISATSKFKSACFESYVIPYLVLNVVYVCIWYFLTVKKGVAYAGVYESSYLIVLVLLGIFFNHEKFDLRFFIGVLLVCGGIILIESK